MSAKIMLRDSVAQLLFLTQISAPRKRSRGRLSIITFHRVLSEAERRSYPFPGLVVTPHELDALLTYFIEHFDCGPLATQHRRFVSGELTARPLLALTFDDAQYDNYRYARPILKRYQLKATFFVPVLAVERQEILWHDRLGFAIFSLLEQGRMGREQLMRILASKGLSGGGSDTFVGNIVHDAKGLTLESRLNFVDALVEASGEADAPEYARIMKFDELLELGTEGHEIGSHSMTHCMMPECDDRALIYELAESRRVLQSRLGLPVESFCYPNGDADRRVANAVAKTGYRRAVTTRWGDNGPDATPFTLRRCDMDAGHMRDTDGNFMPALLAFRMSGLHPGLK